VSPATTLRSYIIDVPTGHVRRNRAHIILQPAATIPSHTDEPPSSNADRSKIITQSRSGVSIRPPDRLVYH